MKNLWAGNQRLWTATLSLTMAFAVGCGTTTSDGGNDTPTVDNATDYPSVGVSETCGGKCDDPDAALRSSSNRLISTLEMVPASADEEDPAIFRLTAEVVDEEYENIENGQTLTVELSALSAGEQCVEAAQCAEGEACVDGYCVSSEELPTVTADIVFEEEGVGAFISDTVDTTELGEWQVLHAEVAGEYGDLSILQAFDFAQGDTQGTEILPEQPEDPFAAALDVNAGAIYIDPEVPAPDYERAQGVDEFNLGGTEFWQRWPGGHDPTFSYSAGTELGRKCMYASARRFEAIMTEAPESILQLKDESNWRGSFFNWNDDYSHEDANGGPTGAVLWAWRTGLVKWISQTGPDGTCYLPTLDMVERAASNCLAEAERSDGEIEGCQAY